MISKMAVTAVAILIKLKVSSILNYFALTIAECKKCKSVLLFFRQVAIKQLCAIKVKVILFRIDQKFQSTLETPKIIKQLKDNQGLARGCLVSFV